MTRKCLAHRRCSISHSPLLLPAERTYITTLVFSSVKWADEFLPIPQGPDAQILVSEARLVNGPVFPGHTEWTDVCWGRHWEGMGTHHILHVGSRWVHTGPDVVVIIQ